MNGVSSTTYRYNRHGCLKQINLPGGKWEKFYYDGLGRRIKTEYYDGSTTTRKYVYLGGSVIRELDNSPTPVVLKEYIRGPDLGGGIRGIIYQKKSSSFYYYHYNHKRDVCALTDSSQNLAAYYEYDAWGNTMTQAEVSGVENPYRYSTKEWDEHSGLYYFGARYYYPEAGRWTQRDPLGVVDGLNLYAYVKNQPPSGMDPWGLQNPAGMGGPLNVKPPPPPIVTPAHAKKALCLLRAMGWLGLKPPRFKLRGGSNFPFPVGDAVAWWHPWMPNTIWYDDRDPQNTDIEFLAEHIFYETGRVRNKPSGHVVPGWNDLVSELFESTRRGMRRRWTLHTCCTPDRMRYFLTEYGAALYFCGIKSCGDAAREKSGSKIPVPAPPGWPPHSGLGL